MIIEYFALFLVGNVAARGNVNNLLEKLALDCSRKSKFLLAKQTKEHLEFVLLHIFSFWPFFQDRNVKLSSVQFSSVQFSSVQFSSVQFSSVQFSSVQFSFIYFRFSTYNSF